MTIPHLIDYVRTLPPCTESRLIDEILFAIDRSSHMLGLVERCLGTSLKEAVEKMDGPKQSEFQL